MVDFLIQNYRLPYGNINKLVILPLIFEHLTDEIQYFSSQNQHYFFVQKPPEPPFDGPGASLDLKKWGGHKSFRRNFIHVIYKKINKLTCPFPNNLYQN